MLPGPGDYASMTDTIRSCDPRFMPELSEDADMWLATAQELKPLIVRLEEAAERDDMQAVNAVLKTIRSFLE